MTQTVTGRHASRMEDGDNSGAMIGGVWNSWFPAEQARIVWLLVTRIDNTTSRTAVWLRAETLATLIEQPGMRAAA